MAKGESAEADNSPFARGLRCAREERVESREEKESAEADWTSSRCRGTSAGPGTDHFGDESGGESGGDDARAEQRLSAIGNGERRARAALHAYGYAHYVLLIGIVVLAAGMHSAIAEAAHPLGPLARGDHAVDVGLADRHRGREQQPPDDDQRDHGPEALDDSDQPEGDRRQRRDGDQRRGPAPG